MNKILVVDDNSIDLKTIKHTLEQEDYTVITASNGIECLSIINSISDIDLLLVDYMMPNLSGLEVLKKLQAEPRTKDIPVVILTADSDPEKEIEVLKNGALDFITKPIIPEVLLQRIKHFLILVKDKKKLEGQVYSKKIELRDREENFDRLAMQVIKCLAGTIDAKDRYTNGHSVRVAQYSKMIALKMNKSETEAQLAYFCALLHDIGKIGIPDGIINKKTNLSLEEYEIIKNHTQIGSDILKQVTVLPLLSHGAHWHHEHFDGNGYPDGLKGKQIPEIARIIAVADSYDAMTSYRSYRDPHTQKIAREELLKNKGKQFDPEIVDIMITLIDEDTDFRLREIQ